MNKYRILIGMDVLSFFTCKKEQNLTKATSHSSRNLIIVPKYFKKKIIQLLFLAIEIQ